VINAKLFGGRGKMITIEIPRWIVIFVVTGVSIDWFLKIVNFILKVILKRLKKSS